MKEYTKIYMDAFGYDESDWIPCEVCGKQSVDIHHIEARGMGGSGDKNTIENLMAVCRKCHIQHGDIKERKQWLKDIHAKHLRHI